MSTKRHEGPAPRGHRGAFVGDGRHRRRPRPADADVARIQVDLAGRVADVTRLGDLGTPAMNMTDIQPVLDQVVHTVTAILQADGGALLLYDAERDGFLTSATVGLPAAYLDTVGRLTRSQAETVLAVDAPVMVEDLQADPGRPAPWKEAAEVAGYRAIFSVPLLTLADELMGSIAVYFRRPRRPAIGELRLAEDCARQVAGMIERARLHGEARSLITRERRRAAQLRRLAETALTLHPVTSVQELLHIVTEGAREIVGAHQAATSHLEASGWSHAHTVVSLSEKYAQWRSYDVAPKGLGLVSAVLRNQRPLRLNGRELAAHPDWRGLRDAPGHPPLPNYLAAPLVTRAGQSHGLIQLADKYDDEEFTAEDEAILVQLAQMASVAIENALLIERERRAREQAEENARLRGLLSDASQAFSSSLELDRTLKTVTDLIVPQLADWCAVYLLKEPDEIVLAASAAADEHLGAVLHDLAGRGMYRLDQQHGVGSVIRTGRSEIARELSDAMLRELANDVVSLEELRRAPVRTGIVVPLRARGSTIGALTLTRAVGPAYSEPELELAEDLARRAALAVDNALRYAFERDAAATLQRSLLPRDLPAASSVQTAARYLPGASGTEIGGDWYDLIDLGDGRLGLVVGDVMGRGIPAAAVMGQVRTAVRAYAYEGHEPADLLTRLDRVVQALGEVQLTTCVYGVFDPDSRRVTLASAGHLPPLVIQHVGPALFLDLDPGLPLGVGGAQYVQATTTLAAGSTILLYTDGLVEGPDCPVDEGMQRLRNAVQRPAHSPDELCDRVLRELGRDGHHDDDTALLAVMLTPQVRQRRGDGRGGGLSVEPVPESAARVREFIGEALHAKGLERHAETAVLLVNELASNALRHARTRLQVHLDVQDGSVHIAVTDGSGDLPQVRSDVGEEDETGRGMVLVELLSDRWGCERVAGGKRVWFELDVERPVLDVEPPGWHA